MKTIRKLFLVVAITAVLSGSLFGTENSFKLFGIGDTFQLNPVKDGILLGTGLSLTGAYFLVDKVIKVKDTYFDGNLLNREDVNPVDRLFMNPYSDPLHKTANCLVAAELLSPALLAAVTPSDEWLTIGTMYTEAFLLTYGIKELTKALVNRPRPYMYFEGYPQAKVDDGDWCKSWPSGHTTNAFLGASFTSYVFCKYHPDSPWRFAVIGATYAVAATTGILRMASGNHFLTDVLTGATIGTVCGILVPYLHTLGMKNSDGSSDKSLEISPLGVSFSIKL